MASLCPILLTSIVVKRTNSKRDIEDPKLAATWRAGCGRKQLYAVTEVEVPLSACDLNRSFTRCELSILKGRNRPRVILRAIIVAKN